ncbi:hypothetical protein Scep_026839 [Stephania cephalantha]|uniref:Uncharacterized protein n=1 Tax=Stephania cephalantha TaxID=152367 RepID=A0AAP0HTN5_9MAGN
MVPLERCLDGVSSIQWFLSFDREMFGDVVVNGSSRFSYDDSRCLPGSNYTYFVEIVEHYLIYKTHRGAAWPHSILSKISDLLKKLTAFERDSKVKLVILKLRSVGYEKGV